MRFTVILLLCSLCGSAHGQQLLSLELLFEATGRPALLEQEGVFYFGGDGLGSSYSLLLTREDDDGLLTGIQTVVPETGEVTWRMTGPHIDGLGFSGGVRARAGGGIETNNGVFIGLANLFGDDKHYPVFAGEGKVLVVDPESFVAYQDLFGGAFTGTDDLWDVRAGIADSGVDGLHVLVVYLPESEVVQVWTDNEQLAR